MIGSEFKFNTEELDIERFRQDSFEDLEDIHDANCCYRKPLLSNLILFVVHFALLALLLFCIFYFTLEQKPHPIPSVHLKNSSTTTKDYIGFETEYEHEENKTNEKERDYND